MNTTENGKNEIVYEPNTFGGPVQDPSVAIK
jgi:hypothetical protein